MSNFAGLNTALTGLRAAQVGLDTAAHIGRIRDSFLDARVRSALAQSVWLDTRSQLVGRMEGILGEPDTGLTAELGALWDAFENLAADPPDGAARRQVASALGSFAARVGAIHSGWNQLESDTTTRLDQAVSDANALLARVDEINRTPPAASLRGQAPNDLLDERDVLLDELARELGADVEFAADGRVTVVLQDQALVGDGVLNQLRLDDQGLAIHDPAGGAGVPVTAGGEAGALREFLTVEMPAQHAALDEFVIALADQLNALHAEGADPSGQPGGPLLVFAGEAGVGTLRVDAAILADPGKLAAGLGASPQDGRNAERLAALRAAAVNGATFDQQLAALVVDLGAKVAAAIRSADAQASLTVAAGNARMSVHEVSPDEEMVAVVQFQRSLDAVSRVMTAVDQALDTLINRTGVVGR